MASVPNSKPVLTEALYEADLSAHAPDTSGLGLSVRARYYFNLTDGETMIRDEEGIEASSIQAAAVSALEAAEELRAQDPANSDEWQGWRLEIVDASGRAVQTIPLDARSAHQSNCSKAVAQLKRRLQPRDFDSEVTSHEVVAGVWKRKTQAIQWQCRWPPEDPELRRELGRLYHAQPTGHPMLVVPFWEIMQHLEVL